MAATTPHRLITASEFADRLALSKRTFYRRVAAGIIPDATVRFTRKSVRWHEAVVNDYIARLQGNRALPQA